MSAAPGVGLGASTTTTLRTSFFSNVTATVGTGIWTGFLKPGSVFDPCGDLAAIQPQFFDQFAAMYNRYKVNWATVRVKITGITCANAAVWVAATYPAVDSTALTTYQAAASQQFARTTSGGFQNVSGGVGIGTEGKYISFRRLSNSAVCGAKTDPYDNGALVTADPTNLQYMVMPMFLQGSLAGAHTWCLEIDIYQNVTFNEKKNTVDA